MGRQINTVNVVTDLESNKYVDTNQENLVGTYWICDCSFCREASPDPFETSPEKDMAFKSKPPENMSGGYSKSQVSANVSFHVSPSPVP